MTPKYSTDSSDFIHLLSYPENFVMRQSLFKIGTNKIDDYDTEGLQASQLNYFTPNHTHYCLRQG